MGRTYLNTLQLTGTSLTLGSEDGADASLTLYAADTATPVLTVMGSQIINGTMALSGPITSGGTDLSQLMASRPALIQTAATVSLLTRQMTTKASLSGATFTGSVDFSTISSGGTDIGTLFASAAITGGGGTTVRTFSESESYSTTNTDYIFEGGEEATLTLVALASASNRKFTLTNIGTAPVLVDSIGAGNDIFDTTGLGAANSINVNANESYMFVCNGTYYVATKLN